MGATCYGSGSKDELARVMRQKASAAAEDFGMFASHVDSPGSRQGTVEGPSSSDRGTTVTARFVQDDDAPDGSAAPQRLVTLRPTTIDGLSPVQMLTSLTQELAAFVATLSVAQDVVRLRGALAGVPSAPAILHVDGSRLEGWSLRVGHVQGIICRHADRAIMWLGTNRTTPPIFTEELTSVLRQISPTKMVG